MNIHRIKSLFIFSVVCLVAVSLLGAKNAHAFGIDVHIPEKYTSVVAGERLYFEVSIEYPENPIRKDLRLDYAVKEGNTEIASSEFLKAVENQASFIDFIVIPEDAAKGAHTVSVHVTDGDGLDQTADASFNVIKPGNQLLTYFLILLGAILIFGFIAIFQLGFLEKKIEAEEESHK